MGDSYLSQVSVDENGNSLLSGSGIDDDEEEEEEGEEEDALASSMLEAGSEADGEQLTPNLKALERDDDKMHVTTSDDLRGSEKESIEDADAELISGMKGITLPEDMK
jgi:hypothetical protein